MKLLDIIVMSEMTVLLGLGIVLALAVLRRVLWHGEPPDGQPEPQKKKRDKIKMNKREDDLFAKIAAYTGGVMIDDDDHGNN